MILGIADIKNGFSKLESLYDSSTCSYLLIKVYNDHSQSVSPHLILFEIDHHDPIEPTLTKNIFEILQLRSIFTKSDEKSKFQVIQASFFEPLGCHRLGLSNGADISINVLVDPELGEKVIEEISVDKDYSIIKLEKFRIQNKCLLIVEDFKVVERVIDKIGNPTQLTKVFYEDLRNHKGWAVTPSVIEENLEKVKQFGTKCYTSNCI